MAEMRSGAMGLYPFVVVGAFGVGGFFAVVFSGLIATRMVRALSWRPALEGWRGILPRGMTFSEVMQQFITPAQITMRDWTVFILNSVGFVNGF